GVFLVLPEGVLSLELLPSSSEVLLNPSDNFTVVCSGWSQVSWLLPEEILVEGVEVEDQGSVSTLNIFNASWKHSGRYLCEEGLSSQSKRVDIFIPGRGPEEWFPPTGLGVVMRENEEGTIPCVVSDPQLSVSLYKRTDRKAVGGLRYEPGRGFTGPLNDTSYLCVASDGRQQVDSQVYYVFSVIVPKVMEVDLTASSRVLKQGELLTVNCTVQDTEMVYFNWDFPRKQIIEPLMDFLPNRIRSFLNISEATVADSGVYACTVQTSMKGRRVTHTDACLSADQGYVYLWPSGETNVSSLLHHTVEFSVEVDAHPAPTVRWTKDNQTVQKDTTSVTTTHLTGTRYVSTLKLVRVRLDQSGSYGAAAHNQDAEEEVLFHLEVKVPPKIIALSEVRNKVMLCISEGAPPPSVTWYSCQNSHRCSNVTDSWRRVSEGGAVQENVTKLETRGVTQVHSALTLQSLSSLSAVRCEASNSAGRRARDLRIQSASLFSQVAVLAAVLVLVFIAVVFLIVLILLWRKKPQYEVRWKVIQSVSLDGQQYTYLDPAHLPYNSTWEVPRDNIVLGQVLGSGVFGRVVEANVSGLLHSHSTTKVAVKMVKGNSGAVQSLMSELKVLVHLGPHLNIVNLLGACTRKGPVYLITEFCRHGDLSGYLERNRHTFLQGDKQTKSDADGGYMDMNKEESVEYVTRTKLSYADIEPAAYETPYTPADQREAMLLLSDSPLLTLHDLLSFSFQVAKAMDFLSSRNCLHRDLAARNVLVCEGKLAKVCDFGLARDLTRDQNYVAKGNTFLPVKWMSPESIFQSVYSCQSDVWSYGILLWEIFSLGGSPYPDLPLTQEFYSALKRGYRMNPPEHAPQNISDLMKRCWEEKPQARPAFSSLVASVGNMLTDDYKKRYHSLAENFLKGEQPAVARSRAAGDQNGETEAKGLSLSSTQQNLQCRSGTDALCCLQSSRFLRWTSTDRR
uniref:receptor protein-tyrosine kinase n=1 Tax=Tetraodon nigroviridis TaxID=99883 RepID=H3CQ90_TETNG